MKSFKEYLEFQEAVQLLADCDIDPQEFAEWAISNEKEFREGLAGNIAGWAGRQAGNAARWGAQQAGNAAASAGRWGAQQVGNAAVGAANMGMRGINRAGQGMQTAANNYERWRDPISRIDTATKALDQVVAAYGDHRVDGISPAGKIIFKIKTLLSNLKQSIDREKMTGTSTIA